MTKRKIRKKTLDQRVDALEGKTGVGVCGTVLQKILMDNKLLVEKGLKVKDANRQSQLIWTLGIGGLLDPKMWVYGHTIEEAVTAAERLLKAGTALNCKPRR
jgi:hypothetical protein